MLPAVKASTVEEFDRIPLEESYLYSNRSYWYPQPGSPNYATARMRLSVPASHGLAASGDVALIGTTSVTHVASPALAAFPRASRSRTARR